MKSEKNTGPLAIIGNGQRKLFCPIPFRRLAIQQFGNSFLCCSTWLPKTIGSYTKSPESVFNSKAAQDIRASILDGTFSYCDLKRCGNYLSGSLPFQDEVTDPFLRAIIDQHQLVIPEGPSVVALNYDKSCSLSCPSCRTKRIDFNRGRLYEQTREIHRSVVADVLDSDQNKPILLNICGSGDPFSSRVLREFLFEFDGINYSNVKIQLMTSGVMLTEKYWKRMHKIHANISNIVVSFDAATKETYSIVRRGGDWKQLVQNTRFLSEERASGRLANLELHSVVQLENFREMPLLVSLAKSFAKVDTVRFEKVLDWNTWQKLEFEKHAIWREAHPLFEDFLKILADPILGQPEVKLMNLSRLRLKALGAASLPCEPTEQ